MTTTQLTLLGFGNVGKALLNLLERKRGELSQRYDVTFTVTGIATLRHGVAIDPQGIDPKAALAAANLDEISVLPAPASMSEFIQECPAEVLFETTPVNYLSGQPAVDYLKAALNSGKHAISANKGPVVHAYRQLKELAAANNRAYYFESTVMDGAPIFSLFREALPAARLLSINGILNSTTNMILTRMEAGESFDRAVEYCQQIGIAETDPSGDIDGWDAAVKIAALVTVLMEIPTLPVDVERQGIAHLTPEDIKLAREQGKRWKLVCSAKREGNGARVRVAPQLMGVESPLYHAGRTTSMVEFVTDVLGPLTILEHDSGKDTTAYGMLADMLRALGRI